MRYRLYHMFGALPAEPTDCEIDRNEGIKLGLLPWARHHKSRTRKVVQTRAPKINQGDPSLMTESAAANGSDLRRRSQDVVV